MRSRLQKSHPQELASRRAMQWDGHGEPCGSPTLYLWVRWGTIYVSQTVVSVRIPTMRPSFTLRTRLAQLPVCSAQ